MMNVLIIPSWYPNIDRPNGGSFYKEQTKLISENGCQTKVLFGKQITISKTNFYALQFKKKIKNRKIELNKSYLIQDPDAYSFEIFLPKWASNEIKYDLLCEYYEAAFMQIISLGWKPDLIQAFSTDAGGIVSRHLALKFVIPYSIIEHQIFTLSNVSNFWRRRMFLALQDADHTAAISYHQKRSILSQGIKCHPKIIWNLVDETEFKFRNSPPDGIFTILTIGYFSYIKDQETFFKSIAILKNKFNIEFKAIIIGKGTVSDAHGTYSDMLVKMANKYGVKENCEFKDQVSHEEIANEYGKAHVYVSTSIAETFGLTVREAMLSGVPVICTRSGGVEDIVNDKTGYLVDIGDAEEIAYKYMEVYNRKESINLLENRELVINQSGRKRFIENINRFYVETLNNFKIKAETKG